MSGAIPVGFFHGVVVLMDPHDGLVYRGALPAFTRRRKTLTVTVASGTRRTFQLKPKIGERYGR